MLVDCGPGDVPTLLDVADGDFHCLFFSFTELVSRSVNLAVSIEKTKTCLPVNMLVCKPVNMYARLHVYVFLFKEVLEMRLVLELCLLLSFLVAILAVCRLLGGRCRPLFCLSFLTRLTIHPVRHELLFTR